MEQLVYSQLELVCYKLELVCCKLELVCCKLKLELVSRRCCMILLGSKRQGNQVLLSNQACCPSNSFPRVQRELGH